MQTPLPAAALATLFQAAIDALPHAVALLSAEGSIELANELAASLFALKPGMIAGESTPAWLAALVSQARRAGAPIKPHSYKSAIQIFDKNRELFFLPHAIPLFDPVQQLAGILVILENATELRQVEEAKSGLLSAVSHELKTPLTSIQMALHLLQEDNAGNLSARQQELLQTAAEDADRLQDLIQRLLDKGRQK